MVDLARLKADATAARRRADAAQRWLVAAQGRLSERTARFESAAERRGARRRATAGRPSPAVDGDRRAD